MADVRIPLRLHDHCAANDVTNLLMFLEERGTFHFPTLPNGLFSAAAGDNPDLEVTGYRNVWVRDNVHIAHAHWKWGDNIRSIAAMKAMMAFFQKHRFRFTDVIDGRVDASNPMNRPHIRFDGDNLVELNEKWSHAQNDALGAFLWLAGKMANECSWDADELSMIDVIAQFLTAIEFWNDEDSGHWEEVRKVSASSIGVATAAFAEWDSRFPATSEQAGRGSLELILPSECVQTDLAKKRRHDSALLFLIYPYQIVTGDMADQIVREVTTSLMGEHGIRRYVGDSYWCADYKEKLAANVRTADFSDNLADRDRLLEPGREAQWCLFDPIISIHYGLRYEATGNPECRISQIRHLNRSLSQLTKSDDPRGAYRCPESYYLSRGKYVPNDICPLLWTQANLKLALTYLIRSLS